MNLTDIHRASHPAASEYFFSSAHITFARIDHKLDHKKKKKKAQKLQDNRKYIKYLFQPQLYETKNQ